jgi:nucleoside-diphosphate-sugar epimerase
MVLAVEIRKSAGGVFNIASGKATPILSLLKVAERATGKRVRPSFASARPGEVKHSCASIAKARRVLGFRPSVTLEAGLRRLAGS